MPPTPLLVSAYAVTPIHLCAPSPTPPHRRGSCLPRRVLGRDAPDCRRRRAQRVSSASTGSRRSCQRKGKPAMVDSERVRAGQACPARGGAVTFLWRGKVRGDTPIMRHAAPVVPVGSWSTSPGEGRTAGPVAYGPWRSSKRRAVAVEAWRRSDGRIRGLRCCATHRRGRRDLPVRGMSARHQSARAVPDV